MLLRARYGLLLKLLGLLLCQFKLLANDKAVTLPLNPLFGCSRFGSSFCRLQVARGVRYERALSVGKAFGGVDRGELPELVRPSRFFRALSAFSFSYSFLCATAPRQVVSICMNGFISLSDFLLRDLIEARFKGAYRWLGAARSKRWVSSSRNSLKELIPSSCYFRYSSSSSVPSKLNFFVQMDSVSSTNENGASWRIRFSPDCRTRLRFGRKTPFPSRRLPIE